MADLQENYPRCKTCIHFLATGPWRNGQPLGECRKRSPVLVGTSQQHQTAYPETLADDGCGDHKDRRNLDDLEAKVEIFREALDTIARCLPVADVDYPVPFAEYLQRKAKKALGKMAV